MIFERSTYKSRKDNRGDKIPLKSEISFESYSDTNSIGPTHEENQDSVFTSESDLVFAVADGLGGYEGGKEASQIAVDLVNERSNALVDEDDILSCVNEIDRRIKEKANELRYPGMGTTLALAKVNLDANQILTANVGDSPILKISDGVIPLYVDDSLRFQNPKNMWAMIQYLGCEGITLDVHTKISNFKIGDTLFLCSDGVSDNILSASNDFSKMSGALEEFKHARALVERAMQRRLKVDDMSVIIVFL